MNLNSLKQKITLVLSVIFVMSILIVPVEARGIMNAELQFYTIVSEKGRIFDITNDNKYVISADGYYNQNIYLTDISTNEAILIPNNIGGDYSSKRFSNDHNLLVMASYKRVDIIDISKKEVVFSFDPDLEPSSFRLPRLSNDNTKLFIANGSGTFNSAAFSCFNVSDGQLLYRYMIPENSTTGNFENMEINLLNNEVIIAYEKMTQIRDLNTFNLKKTMDIVCNSISFSNDWKYMITDNGVHNALDGYSLKENVSFPILGSNLTFTYDNKMLSKNRLYDLESSNISEYVEITNSTDNYYFSHDGKYIYDLKGNIYFSDNLFDTQSPVVGNNGKIEIKDATENSITLNWTKATDDFTPPANLKYYMYKSEKNNLNSVFDCEHNGELVNKKGTKDIDELIVDNLTPNTTYYFNIVVVNEDGEKSTYTLTAASTTSAPPSVGNSGKIEVADRAEDSVLLNWTKATADNTAETDLKYYVYQSELNNLNSVEECEKNGTPLNRKGTNNIDTFTVEDLTFNTIYYFNVVVANGESKSAYTTVEVSTLSAPPTVENGEIQFKNLNEKSVTLNWTKATDDNTDEINLKYYIYKSELDNLNSAEECELNGTLINENGTEDIDELTVNDLLPNTTYYFNVVVADSDNRKTAYTTISVSTLSAPPVAGNNGIIEAKNISENSVVLNWTKATSDNVAQSQLKYYVYQSENDNLKSIAECETNGTLINVNSTDNINRFNVKDLTQNKKYYFNIIVADSNDKKSIYKTVSVTTLATPPVVGNNGMIEIKEIKENSISLSWVKAEDENTPQSDLKYYIYLSVLNNLNSAEDCNVYGTLRGSGTDIDSIDITDLSANKTYYFNVVVENDGGRKSIYKAVSVKTLQTVELPIVKNPMIRARGVSDTSLLLTWAKAYDEVPLKYYIYKSESDNLNSIDECKANGTLVNSGAEDINMFNVKNLSPNTVYYFNVIVANVKENEAIYSPISVKTISSTDKFGALGAVVEKSNIISENEEENDVDAMQWIDLITELSEKMQKIDK